MNVREVMTNQIETVDSENTIEAAAKTMESMNIGALPVQEERKIVGILTDRDITVRAVATGKNPTETKVKEAMSPAVFCCHDDESIEDAVKRMSEHQVHRLIVVDQDNKPCGILALQDIALKAHNAELEASAVEGIRQPS